MKLMDAVKVINDNRYHVNVYNSKHSQYAMFDVDYLADIETFAKVVQKESMFYEAEVISIRYSDAYKAICIDCEMAGKLPVCDGNLLPMRRP